VLSGKRFATSVVKRIQSGHIYARTAENHIAIGG